jgi:hypothetical protein
MASVVANLQRDILDSKKSVTEILRTAKVISAKLGLSDITTWIESELTGYNIAAGQNVPSYRQIKGGHLEVFNPYRGWEFAGAIDEWKSRTSQPISELEELAKGDTITITPPQPFPLRSFDGLGGHEHFPQQVVFSTVQVRRILEAVKEQILNWAIELEQRGIMGEDMSFDKKEKQKAEQQTFNIQNFTGVLGDVSRSTVEIHNYSTIHQLLRERGVQQNERNELDNILDELKQAEPAAKAGLLKRGKIWIVRNQDPLGAGANIVRTALGIPSVV